MAVLGYTSGRSMRSSSRSRLTAGTRIAAPTRTSVSSSSLPSWAVQSHQELLAARDVEALLSMANGASPEFIAYVKERVTAGQDEATKAMWDKFFTENARVASEKAAAKSDKAYTIQINDLAQQVQAGEKSAQEFLTYLQQERAAATPGSDKHLFLTKTFNDTKNWLDLMVRAQQKQHDSELSAALDAGEITLEAALTDLQGQRELLQPGDEAWAHLTTQITTIKSGIAARDFNAEVQTANGKLEAAGNSTAAKKEYLQTLVGLTTRAKTTEAQAALTKQIGAVRDSITKDEQLGRAQAANQMMIDYYAGKKTAPEVAVFLRDLASKSTDPAEAAKYESLTATVDTRERTLARQAGSGGGGAKVGTSAWVDQQLNQADHSIEGTYKKALDFVNDAAKNGEVITADDPRWKAYMAASNNYNDALRQLTDRAPLDSNGRQSVESRGLSLNDDVTAQGTLFGDNAIKKARFLETQVKNAVEKLKPASGPTVFTSNSGTLSLLKQIDDLAANPFIHTMTQKQDAVTIRQGAADTVGSKLQTLADAYAGKTAARKTIESEYATYVEEWNRTQSKHKAPLADLATFVQTANDVSLKPGDVTKKLGVAMTTAQLSKVSELDKQNQNLRVTNAANLRDSLTALTDEAKSNPALFQQLHGIVMDNNLGSLPGAPYQYTGALDESLKAWNLQQNAARAAAAAAAAGGPAQSQGGGGGSTPRLLAPVQPDVVGADTSGNSLDSGMIDTTNAPAPQSPDAQSRNADVVQPGDASAGGAGPLDAAPTDQQTPAFDMAAFRSSEHSTSDAFAAALAAAWGTLSAPTDYAIPMYALPPLLPENAFMPPVDLSKFDFSGFASMPDPGFSDFGTMPPPPDFSFGANPDASQRNTDFNFQNAAGGGYAGDTTGISHGH